MSGYLLDTNIVSELRRRDRTNPGVLTWFHSVDDDDLFLSVMTLGEIRKGIEQLRRRDATQAVVLEQWLNTLETTFAGRLLAVDSDAADQWGKLQAIRPVPIVDALLAATCLRDTLTLVTRNDTDFDGLGISVLNPFS
jgi:predicted nucleic acid-binding protein